MYNEDGELLTRKCPVCGNLAFPRRKDSYGFCAKCGWQDEEFQEENPDENLGTNYASLNQARDIWKQHHCNVDEYYLAHKEEFATDRE